jgi:hypothetical protein
MMPGSVANRSKCHAGRRRLPVPVGAAPAANPHDETAFAPGGAPTGAQPSSCRIDGGTVASRIGSGGGLPLDALRQVRAVFCADKERRRALRQMAQRARSGRPSGPPWTSFWAGPDSKSTPETPKPLAGREYAAGARIPGALRFPRHAVAFKWRETTRTHGQAPMCRAEHDSDRHDSCCCTPKLLSNDDRRPGRYASPAIARS